MHYFRKSETLTLSHADNFMFFVRCIRILNVSFIILEVVFRKIIPVILKVDEVRYLNYSLTSISSTNSPLV